MIVGVAGFSSQAHNSWLLQEIPYHRSHCKIWQAILHMTQDSGRLMPVGSSRRNGSCLRCRSPSWRRITMKQRIQRPKVGSSFHGSTRNLLNFMIGYDKLIIFIRLDRFWHYLFWAKFSAVDGVLWYGALWSACSWAFMEFLPWTPSHMSGGRNLSRQARRFMVGVIWQPSWLID